jgi:hypothetical protein
MSADLRDLVRQALEVAPPRVPLASIHTRIDALRFRERAKYSAGIALAALVAIAAVFTGHYSAGNATIHAPVPLASTTPVRHHARIVTHAIAYETTAARPHPGPSPSG